MAYRIQIREAESATDKTWHDVTEYILSTGFSVRSGFATLGSNADLGKLSLSYRTYDLATASMFGSTTKLIRVIEDDRIVFEGYSDSASTVDSTENAGLAWVKLTAYPYIKALEDVELSDDWVAYDMTVKAIAEQLWSKALAESKSWVKESIEDSVTITFPEISKTIPLVKVSKGDKPLDTLVSMMAEFCYSIVSSGDNIVRFIQPYSADPLRYASIPFESIYTKPTIKTSPYVKTKAPQVTLSKTVVKEDIEVYSLTGEEGKNAEKEIYKDGTDKYSPYYPEDGDAEVSYSNPDIENDMVSFLWAKDLSLKVESRRSDNSADGDIVFTRSDLMGDKAYYRIKNISTTISCYLNQLRIIAGTAYFSDKSYVVRAEGNGEKTEVETEWIQTSEDAILYAKALADESRCSTSSLVFKSDILEGMAPGMLLKVGNIPAIYIIKSIEKDLDKNETTFSCQIYNIKDIATDTFYRPPSTLRGPKGEDAPTMYYVWSMSPDELIVPSKAIWSVGEKWMLFNGSLMGDFGIHDWESSWEKLMESRTETYNYLWAKVGEDGEPFRLQGVSPMDFSVLATPPSYTVNPRRKDAFTMTVKITRLNGIKGTSSLVLDGSSYSGITVSATDNEDEWTISIAQSTTTSLSFSLNASVGGVEKKITLAGTMIDYSSKYMGAVDSLPSMDIEGNKLLEGDWCVLKSDNLMYVYKAGAWVSVVDSQVNSFGELEKMSTALVDMIAIGSTQSTTATILGIFKLLCADNGFIKFLKTWALYCGAGDENSGFYCRIADHDPTTGQALTKPLFIVKYNGNTVFQIDPSTGNVFFGKPNSGLSAPESGFMYDATNKRIVSKDNKVVINEDGSIYALDGSFSGTVNATNGSFAGTLNGATGSFNGNFSTPSLDCRPSSGGTSYSGTLSAGNYESQFKVMESLRLSIGGMDELVSCTVSNYPDIKYVSYHEYIGFATSYIYTFYNASLQSIKNGNTDLGIAKNNLKGDISYNGLSSGGTITVSKGTGSILVFKDIGAYSSSLISGQIYKNSNNQLCIVP